MNNDLVILELDKVRSLRFRTKAIKQIEKLFGCKLSKALEKMSDLDIDTAIKICHIGLTWEDAELTLNQLEDLIDDHITVGELLSKISEALELAFGGIKNGQTMATVDQ